MGQYYRVHPIPVCQITVDEGTFFFLRMNEYGKKVTIPVHVWLVEGRKETTLVDTACSAAEFCKYALFAEHIKDIAAIEEALPSAGLGHFFL